MAACPDQRRGVIAHRGRASARLRSSSARECARRKFTFVAGHGPGHWHGPTLNHQYLRLRRDGRQTLTFVGLPRPVQPHARREAPVSVSRPPIPAPARRRAQAKAALGGDQVAGRVPGAPRQVAGAAGPRAEGSRSSHRAHPGRRPSYARRRACGRDCRAAAERGARARRQLTAAT